MLGVWGLGDGCGVQSGLQGARFVSAYIAGVYPSSFSDPFPLFSRIKASNGCTRPRQAPNGLEEGCNG